MVKTWGTLWWKEIKQFCKFIYDPKTEALTHFVRNKFLQFIFNILPVPETTDGSSIDKLAETVANMTISGNAAGTSKNYYIDPRISISWLVYSWCWLIVLTRYFQANFSFIFFRCKKHGIPINDIYTESEQKRFQWAIEQLSNDEASASFAFAENKSDLQSDKWFRLMWMYVYVCM